MKTVEESNKPPRKQRYMARKIYQLVQDEAHVDGRAAASGCEFRRRKRGLN